jgi:hypothetical protein
MGAAFGAGICFTLVSGQPNPLQSALSTGAAFAAFNGLFYQVRWKPAHPFTQSIACQRTMHMARWQLLNTLMPSYADVAGQLWGRITQA